MKQALLPLHLALHYQLLCWEENGSAFYITIPLATLPKLLTSPPSQASLAPICSQKQQELLQFFFKRSLQQESLNPSEILTLAQELYDQELLSQKSILETKAVLPPQALSETNVLLETAITKNVSDLHLEPRQDHYLVRWKIEGLLLPYKELPKSSGEAFIAQIKLLAAVDITEKRRPQDGRFSFSYQGRSIDLRLSTLPTYQGESLLVRILDPHRKGRQLHELGFPPIITKKMTALLQERRGLFLVTGATGSGKTTTVYACLQQLLSPTISEKRTKNTHSPFKIITVEDPVEYELPQLQQVSIAPHLGRGFAHMLRALLRNDPDVLMIGEIRDPESAQIALEASLTGHYVLTSLHTGTPLKTIARLMAMGIDPLLVATSLQGILTQRLVQRLCPKCKTANKPSSILKKELFKMAGGGTTNSLHAIDALKTLPPLYRSQGCSECQESGYLGCFPVAELLLPSQRLRELIAQKASLSALQEEVITSRLLLPCPSVTSDFSEAALAALFKGEISWDDMKK